MIAAVLAGVAFVTVGMCAAGAAFVAVTISSGADALADCTAAASASGSGSPAPSTPAGATIGRWGPEQTRNAAIIIAVGKQLRVPPRGWLVALATAMQESSLRNLTGGDRDSLGLFQQRPSQGWGTPAQILDPAYAARKFYEKLVTISGWESMRVTDAAQAVQRSATPEAYQRWEGDAQTLLTALSGAVDPGTWQQGVDQCNPAAALSGSAIPAGQWTQPVHAKVGSGFRPPDRPTHNGVDLIVPKNTPIYAVAAGTVKVVTCNASSGTCDRDGGLDVLGCGWYVEIQHTGGYVSRYCHQVRRPAVTVGQTVQGGQVIGWSGSSGNSSGPHLHFEIHTSWPATGANAVDPVPFMARVGAPLGR